MFSFAYINIGYYCAIISVNPSERSLSYFSFFYLATDVFVLVRNNRNRVEDSFSSNCLSVIPALTKME